MIASALGRPNLKAYEAVKELIVDLGLPSKLADVGISNDLYDKIVEYALEHQIVLSNPKPITKADDVYQILDFAEKGQIMGFFMAFLGLVVAIGLMFIMLKLLDKIGDK